MIEDLEKNNMSQDKELGLSTREVGEVGTDEDRAGDLAAYEIPPEDTKHLLHTLDLHIAPVVMILYLIAFLDRSNIGNAAVGGMTKDLHFPANGLSVCASIFYATYVTFETPAATFLRTLRPSRLIPGITLLWGAILIGNGFAQNYATILALRLVLGACEAALFPCLLVYMTTFYKREELAQRVCYLFIASAISGAVGGLIATGLLKMNGIQGLEGWRWLYIIEGVITFAIGIAVYFFIADTYKEAKYLSERQMFLMDVRNAQLAAYFKDEGLSWKEVRKAFADPMIYLSGFGQMCFDTCLYGFSTFLVVIINQLGFNPIASQGLTAPVYFFAALVYFVGAVASDKYSVRCWIMVPLGLVSCVGYIILIAVKDSVGAKLFGCFLAGAGIYILVGLHLTWLSQNLAGYRKRSTGMGMQQTMGNLGGIIAGQIYRSPDAPRYLLGNAASLGFMAVGICVLVVEWTIWRSRNARKAAMTESEKGLMDDAGVDGDHHYDFVYVL